MLKEDKLFLSCTSSKNDHINWININIYYGLLIGMSISVYQICCCSI